MSGTGPGREETFNEVARAYSELIDEFDSVNVPETVSKGMPWWVGSIAAPLAFVGLAIIGLFLVREMSPFKELLDLIFSPNIFRALATGVSSALIGILLTMGVQGFESNRQRKKATQEAVSAERKRKLDWVMAEKARREQWARDDEKEKVSREEKDRDYDRSRRAASEAEVERRREMGREDAKSLFTLFADLHSITTSTVSAPRERDGDGFLVVFVEFEREWGEIWTADVRAQVVYRVTLITITESRQVLEEIVSFLDALTELAAEYWPSTKLNLKSAAVEILDQAVKVLGQQIRGDSIEANDALMQRYRSHRQAWLDWEDSQFQAAVRYSEEQQAAEEAETTPGTEPKSE